MASSSERPLDHRYRDEHPIRTLGYLFRADRRHLIAAVGVFTVKHSPVWLLPLITASIIDTVVQHGPIGRLWLSTGIILFILLVNYPLHVLYVRLLYGSVRRMGTALRSALCTRMQQLSIGYHSRVSAGVLQAKVVRDVERDARGTPAPGRGVRATARRPGRLIQAALLRGTRCGQVTSWSVPRLVHQRSQHAASSSSRTISSAAERTGRRDRGAAARRSRMSVSRTTAMTGTRLAAAHRNAAHSGPPRNSRSVVQASPPLVAR